MFAETPINKLKNIGEKGGYAIDTDSTTLSKFAGTAVRAFLGLLGVIFIVLIITAGYQWMMAGGNDDKLKKAKETLWRASIGLFIIIGAYAIWRVVWDSFLIY